MPQTQPHIPPSVATDAGGPPRAGWQRWIVCGLLFLATTINYMDRQVIGLLKPELTREFGWSEIDYGNIVFTFQLAYALGYAFSGRLMDRIGVRVGYALAVGLWSLAAGAHALARSVAGFCLARGALGLAEGGNFPAAVKTVAEWFPRRERALATGIFNAGSNIGAIVTPLTVPWITVTFGWQMAFIATGAIGFLWLAGWLLVYRSPEKNPRVSAAELAWIRSDPADPAVRIPWLELLRHRQTWVFVTGMFLTSPVWWFYLFWVPDFLHRTHGLNLLQLGPPLIAIYLVADIGSVAGGWLSSRLIGRGWSVNAARKTTMLLCAGCVVPVFATPTASNLWVATALISLAAAAHQGWAANLYTLVSDTAPRNAVSSIVGLGGMVAGFGGMFVAQVTGHVLELTGSYVTLFVLASAAYPTALLIMHLLNPRHEPMRLDAASPS